MEASMELILVRHAIAAPALPGEDDASRALTPKGIRRFRRCVRGLGRLGVGIDLLLHSPKRRAVETADLLADLLEGESRVTSLLAAPPSMDLLDLCTAPRVALVGHEPWLGELACWLLTGVMDAASRFAMRKGGVAMLRGEPRPGGMTLVAWWPPSTLRRT